MAIDFEHYAKTGEKRPKGHGPKSTAYSDETISEVLKEISEGKGVRETARKYNIPKSTVSQWVNGHFRVSESLYEVKKREILTSLRRAATGEDCEALAEELARKI